MNDERLHRLLEVADQPLAPDPAFGAALRDELRQELGFIVSTRDAPAGRRSRPAPYPSPPGPDRPVARGRDRRSPAPSGWPRSPAACSTALAPCRSDLYDRIEQAGSIRIAIRPDHPQFSVPGQPAAGFDGDVANEIASHLGLRAAIVLEDGAAMLADRSRWWVGHRAAVGRGLDARSLAVPGEHAVLLVAPSTGRRGDVVRPGARRSRRSSRSAPSRVTRARRGFVARTPVPWVHRSRTQVVTRTSDDECLAALATGEVAALVTARLSDADLQVRSGIRVIGGPGPEARPLIIARDLDGGPDPTDVLGSVDSALDRMRDDGTLTRISQSRFGGADLSAP